MSKELELRCWLCLLGEGRIPQSQLSSRVRRSQAFEQLMKAEIIGWLSQGSGKSVQVLERDLLRGYIKQHYPEHEVEAGGDGFSNVRRYRDSKAGRKAAAQIMLLRGQTTIWLKEGALPVELGPATDSFGCFAAVRPALHTLAPCCIVENLDCFLRAEEVLGSDMVFIHPYGRLGKDSLPGLQAKAVWHFGDYDFTGLNDFLNLKSQYTEAQLYVPENLESLWQKYSTPLKKGAVPSRQVTASPLPEVERILRLLRTTQRFLEQQVLFFKPTDTHDT
jgi:hypothetical protein